MAQERKAKILKVIAIIAAIMLAFSNIVSAGGFSGHKVGGYIGKKIQQNIKEKEKQIEKERNKLNKKYLRIKEKLQNGKKLNEEERRFWDECIDKLKEKQVIKHKKEYLEHQEQNGPKWKQYGSKLFGKWVLNLSEQPEWQPEFYKRLPSINEDAFEPPPEYKEIIELHDSKGGIIISIPAPAPMPIPIIP